MAAQVAEHSPLSIREGEEGTSILALISPATMWFLLAAVGVANRWQLSRDNKRGQATLLSV